MSKVREWFEDFCWIFGWLGVSGIATGVVLGLSAAVFGGAPWLVAIQCAVLSVVISVGIAAIIHFFVWVRP